MVPGDIPLIAGWMANDALWRRYQLSAETIAADFMRGLERGDLIVVADTDLPARGFAWCLLDGMFGARPYLKRFGVDPGVAGKGLGSLLLDNLERELLSRQCHDLFLLVSDFNLEAQRFYQRRDYREIGRIPDLVLIGVAEVIFRKQLARLS
jgi:ribosomal protein S18 acetylase RimI-like enzyme